MISTRSALALLLAASVVVVGTALLSQYVGGLVPCELCLYERWPYYTVIALAVLALLSRKHSFMATVVAIAAIAFGAGTALGAYHVGVEQHWIAGPTACTGDLPSNSPEALLQALQGRQPVDCDQVQWSLFGLSLAGMNALASLALFVFALWALTRARAGARR